MEWDSAKNDANILKHGISFERISECDWDEADIQPDTRYDYGEARFTAFLPLENRLYQVVFTLRGHNMRIISFRKANERERRSYGY